MAGPLRPVTDSYKLNKNLAGKLVFKGYSSLADKMVLPPTGRRPATTIHTREVAVLTTHMKAIEAAAPRGYVVSVTLATHVS